MVSELEKRELKKIKDQNNQPKNEEKIVPIIKNGNQFKIAIPKKLSEIAQLNQDKHKAKIILNKKENKIYIEVINA